MRRVSTAWSVGGRRSSYHPRSRPREPSSFALIGVPGLRKLLQKNYSKWGKCFWATALLLSTVLCLEQMSERIILFLTKPIDVKVTLTLNPYVSFPSFTLCTNNASIFNEDYSMMLKRYKNPPLEFPWQLLDLPNVTIDILWETTAFKESYVQLIPSCSKKDCFKTVMTSTYKGKCLKIFAPDALYYSGANTGFIVKIKSFHTVISEQQNILIYVHEDQWDPTYFIYYAQPLYHAYITAFSIGRRQFKYMDTTKDPCQDTSIVSNCWKKCLENIITAKSLCRLPCMDNKELPVCSTSKSFNVTYSNVIGVFEERNTTLCSHCPRRCSEIMFNSLLDVVRPTASGDTELWIRIPDNSVEVLEERYSYSFVSFLCDIGGTLGLFLGFCVLTIVELLEAFVTTLRSKLRNRQMTYRKVKVKSVIQPSDKYKKLIKKLKENP